MRKQPQFVEFRNGCFNDLEEVLKKSSEDWKTRVFFVDSFFEIEGNDLLDISERVDDIFLFVTKEPTTEVIDDFYEIIVGLTDYRPENVDCIVAIGGGSTMDTAKAISVMLTNIGKTEDYVGFNKVKNKAIFKIGIPTISGTGAEVSSSAVLMNSKTKVKLGINSDECVFDVLLLDPELTKTVPEEQFFYTGMDCYSHCIEALYGKNRNIISDKYGFMAIEQCEEIFDMFYYIQNKFDLFNHNQNKNKQMMLASYIGGFCTGLTGVIHPIAAGLTTLGINHGESIVLSLNVLREYYKEEYEALQSHLSLWSINLKKDVCKKLTKEQWEVIYNAVLIHEKPLKNHFGKDWKKIMTKKKIKEIMSKI